MKLLKDILSMFGGKVYARRGEIVGIISQHGNVWVVEDKDGNKFPVKETDVEVIELEK